MFTCYIRAKIYLTIVSDHALLLSVAEHREVRVAAPAGAVRPHAAALAAARLLGLAAGHLRVLRWPQR